MIEKKDYVTVKVKVEKSNYFYKKEGLNIFSKFDIGPITAMNGGTVSIPGLWDLDLQLKIPAGTSSHEMLILPGEGIKVSDFLEGDHHVEIGINMNLLTNRDKKFLEKPRRDVLTYLIPNISGLFTALFCSKLDHCALASFRVFGPHQG